MPRLYYITTKTMEEAKKIARKLLQENCIAGANIFPIESLYWWEGEICEGEEYALVMQSVKENSAKIEEWVKTLHSYKIPCIVSLELAGGSKDFFHWIKTNTK